MTKKQLKKDNKELQQRYVEVVSSLEEIMKIYKSKVAEIDKLKMLFYQQYILIQDLEETYNIPREETKKLLDTIQEIEWRP